MIPIQAFVDAKLAGGQLLNIEVTLEFTAVVLLAHTCAAHFFTSIVGMSKRLPSASVNDLKGNFEVYSNLDVLAFACVAFEFPDSAGGGQPLFGARRRLRLMMKDSWPKCAKFSSASLCPSGFKGFEFFHAFKLLAVVCFVVEHVRHQHRRSCFK